MGSQPSERQGELRVVEITEPGSARLINEPLPAHDQPGFALVRTTYSAVSPGTELLVFNGDMPEDNSALLDSTITELNAANSGQSGLYPCRYGYSSVGVITHLGPPAEDPTTATTSAEQGVSEEDCPDADQNGHVTTSKPFQVGDRVFAFREHASHYAQRVTNLHLIPAAVSDRDAVFLPAVETAVSILFDAAPLPGDMISIVGQGLIGLVLTAVTRLLHPFCTVITHDVCKARRALSARAAGAHYVMEAGVSLEDKLDHMARHARENDPAEVTEMDDGDIGADVSIDVSGSAAGLNTAVETTRDHGRVVIGSWYGNKPIVAPAFGSARFHRSHIQLVASQVSNVPPVLAARWTKKRRLQLAWRVVEAVRPGETLDVPMFDPAQAQAVFEQLAKKDIIGGVFRWDAATTSATA